MCGYLGEHHNVHSSIDPLVMTSSLLLKIAIYSGFTHFP